MNTKLIIAVVIGALVTLPSFAEGKDGNQNAIDVGSLPGGNKDGNQSGDKTVTSKQYVDSNIAQKQAIITKKANNNTAMTFPTAPGGTPGSRVINTEVGTSTSDTGLATTGAINTALNAKQEKITGGTSGDVVLYNQSGGISGDSKGVYNAGSAYAGQTNKLVEAQHVNSAVTNGFNAHLTCANPSDGCTLWEVNQLSGTYVPQN